MQNLESNPQKVKITESYKIKVTFKNGTYKYIQARKEKLIDSKNVINYVFCKFDRNTVKEIKTRCKNESFGNYYWTLNYSLFFERCRVNRLRVERTNKKGCEDFTGYGSQTNGLKNRFYIGKSTGWIPIYLEVLKSNSHGGGSLFTKGKFQIV